MLILRTQQGLARRSAEEKRREGNNPLLSKMTYQNLMMILMVLVKNLRKKENGQENGRLLYTQYGAHEKKGEDICG